MMTTESHFAGLLSDPDDPVPALRQQLLAELIATVRDLNISVAASVLDIDPARMSDLRAGRVERFSVEWLTRVLVSVGRDVTIAVAPAAPIRWFHLLRERRLSGRVLRRRPVSHRSRRAGARARFL